MMTETTRPNLTRSSAGANTTPHVDIAPTNPAAPTTHSSAGANTTPHVDIAPTNPINLREYS